MEQWVRQAPLVAMTGEAGPPARDRRALRQFGASTYGTPLPHDRCGRLPAGFAPLGQTAHHEIECFLPTTFVVQSGRLHGEQAHRSGDSFYRWLILT